MDEMEQLLFQTFKGYFSNNANTSFGGMYGTVKYVLARLIHNVSK